MTLRSKHKTIIANVSLACLIVGVPFSMGSLVGFTLGMNFWTISFAVSSVVILLLLAGSGVVLYYWSNYIDDSFIGNDERRLTCSWCLINQPESRFSECSTPGLRLCQRCRDRLHKLPTDWELMNL